MPIKETNKLIETSFTWLVMETVSVAVAVFEHWSDTLNTSVSTAVTEKVVAVDTSSVYNRRGKK